MTGLALAGCSFSGCRAGNRYLGSGTVKGKQTTINPFRLDKSEHIVVKGVYYRYTRNPMCLGLAMLLSGWSLIRTSLSGLIVVLVLVF